MIVVLFVVAEYYVRYYVAQALGRIIKKLSISSKVTFRLHIIGDILHHYILDQIYFQDVFKISATFSAE